VSAAQADAQADVHMRRAIELAERGLYTTDPNPRVGCVLVRDGEVVGEGWHVRAGEPHAEVLALRSAGERARGATAYVTLEPCSHTGRTPPCADAVIEAGIARVVCASIDPNPKVAGAGVARLEAAGIAVAIGTMADEARALNVGFFSRFERGRPFIRLKMAMSLDARITAAGGGTTVITGEAARADVQTWRARSSAVLTGAGTVRIDDPRLDVRLAYGPWVRQPLRVVLDSDLTCAPSSRVFDGGQALIFAACGTAGRAPLAIEVVHVPRAARGLDLAAVIGHLTALEVNELLVEGGPRLAASFLEADLVDELVLYVAPLLLGADAAPLAALRGPMQPRGPGPGPGRGPGPGPAWPEFTFRSQRLIGSDLRLSLTPNRIAAKGA
jgi:diaminohydroxyphosphoribosylaminopyrimidine deaminase/5-amino-6-(5-phosphoribosylamino)uracil reductase